MILLIDCNNFFVSCERVFKVHLINKPVIVAGGEGGCVIARSNEAKALGIPMGSPLFKVKDILKKNDIHLCYTNFSLYNDLHNRIMHLIKKTFKTVEIYSIDEEFIDFTGYIKLTLFTRSSLGELA
ncbi:MAG: Protein UmuC [Holosporales bacterium]